jgi:hypothetical protein
MYIHWKSVGRPSKDSRTPIAYTPEVLGALRIAASKPRVTFHRKFLLVVALILVNRCFVKTMMFNGGKSTISGDEIKCFLKTIAEKIRNQ